MNKIIMNCDTHIHLGIWIDSPYFPFTRIELYFG